jgi:type IV secretory pathway VirB6-like protein
MNKRDQTTSIKIYYMILTKKLAQIIALVFLVFFIASCSEECVAPDEFDTNSIVIESNPTTDGISGTYDGVSGGQRASWHSTELRVDSTPLLIQISGSWTALQGVGSANTDALPRCNFCAKRHDDFSPSSNCLCYGGEDSVPEDTVGGEPGAVDCTIAANQEDPLKCTCTQQHGPASAYGVYHFPLNVMNKSGSTKIPDEQTNCKYDRGMGAYISLWGNSGAVTPIRAYHLFSEEGVCNINRNSAGECKDDFGKDVTRYIFRSANGVSLLKDDGDGNNDVDLNTANDVYHVPNEKLKTIMYDNYYSDNYGKYNLRILGGVNNENDIGLLEYLVSLMEVILLGEIDDDGERVGGMIEFMYKSIVKDSGFALTVQVALSLYVALFGAAHLFGIVDIASKKEIMNRVLKISLIIFLIDENSWVWYNQIVVSFFMDSMNYVVGMVMSLQDSNIDPTSMITVAQIDRAVDASSATRFSYVDAIIKNLMSSGVTKKIWGLFFESIFGIIYIPAIYALIFGFIYAMLYVASMYISNLIKIIFVISLGPIFIVFTLFSKTEQMFKNWLAFLAGRSFEIIMIFTTLYFFVNLLDRAFIDMLYYGVCGVNKGIGPVAMVVLISESGRDITDWGGKIFAVAGLVIITLIVMKQIPALVSAIVEVGGVSGGSGAQMAGGLMSAMMDLTQKAAGLAGSVVGKAARYGARGATHALRRSGIADIAHAAGKYIPIPNARAVMRHAIIDGAISKAKAGAEGLTGANRDEYIRSNALKEIQLRMKSEPNKMALYGVDTQTIVQRFDKKLVKEPLKNFLKKEAAAMKQEKPSSIKFGKEARDELKSRATEWAKNNIAEGSKTAEDYMNKSRSMKNLIKTKTHLNSEDAAKIFSGIKGVRHSEDKDRYLRHLMSEQAKRHQKQQDSKKYWYSSAYNKIGRGYRAIRRDESSNPLQAQKKFLREAWQRENGRTYFVRRGRFFNSKKMVEERLGLQKDILADNLSKRIDVDFSRKRLAHLAGKGEGMGDINSLEGKQLFEKTARMARDAKRSHDDEINDYLSERRKAMLGMADAEKDAETARLAELSRMSGDYLEAEVKDIKDVAGLEVAKGDAKFAADSFEIEFGASINDVLLKAPDIGLKAGNVLLGGDAPAEKGVDEAAIGALKVSKNQAAAKKKISIMNQKIAQYTLEQLQKQDPSSLTAAQKSEINSLELEIQGLNKNIKDSEAEENRIGDDMRSRGGSEADI